MLIVLHRDEHLVAVHKPSGLLVHRSLLDAHEERFAVQMLRDQIGRRVYPVHRLDKGTSGVLLFALDPATAGRIGRAFETQQVGKTYLAVVRGHPPEAGVIDHPLSRQWDEVERRAGDVRKNARPLQSRSSAGDDEQELAPESSTAAPQPALTRYRRLAAAELPYRVDRYPTSRYALVALWPDTGRRHQLRRHLKHVSHPIIGDATFGKGRHNRLFAELFGVRRLLLACTRLRLTHPWTGEMLDLQADPAPDFTAVCTALGWQVEEAGRLSAAGDS